MEEAAVFSEVLDNRKGNWFWDYNEVLDSDLSEHAKIVRLCLARFASHYERKAWPSLNKIAEKASISVATVKRALSELEEKGWIERKSRRLPNEAYASTIYILQEPPNLGEKGVSNPSDEGVSSDRANPLKSEGGWLSVSQGLAQTEPRVSSDRAKGWFSVSQGLAQTELRVGSERATNKTKGTIPNRTIPIEKLSLSSSIEEERDVNPEKNAETQQLAQPPQQFSVNPKITNRDLIAELTAKFHELPIEKLKGHFSLIGKAYNRYGYQAVLAAIEDLSIEFLAAEKMGEPLVLSEKELARRLFARCSWNSVSIEKVAPKLEKSKGGGEKEEQPEWQRNWRKVGEHWSYAPEELDPNEWEVDRENKIIRRKKKEKGIICRKGEVAVDAGD